MVHLRRRVVILGSSEREPLLICFFDEADEERVSAEERANLVYLRGTKKTAEGLGDAREGLVKAFRDAS